jgi:predicted LPLAT superfamily acyltransferase
LYSERTTHSAMVEQSSETAGATINEAAWQGRSRGTSLGYQIFIGLLRKGGLGAAYSLLHFVGLYYRLFVPAATRPLRYLYEKRMGFSVKEAARLIKQNIHFFGQTLIDKVAVLTGAGSKLTFTHEGIEHLEALANNGTGGLIVSAHLGNWEVAGHMLQRVGSTINVLMYDGEAEQMKSLMAQYDQKRSFNIIYVREDLSHVYEMSAALRRGELICLHADRFRPGNRTMTHEFLGEEAHFPAGPFLLASKLRAPVCFVFAFKETTFHYHFMAWAAKTYEGRGATGAERMLKDFADLLEEQLRRYPAQWFNYFDFWKARP